MSRESFENIANKEYKFGFKTDIKSNVFSKGLNEDVIKKISQKNDEPDYILEYRLKAFKHWQKMEEPEWALVDYPKIDFQAISYFCAPRSKADAPKSLDEVDPELLETYEKLGIPLHERAALVAEARWVTRRM